MDAGKTERLTKLKPCPYCGGRVYWCGDGRFPGGCGNRPCTRIICRKCGEFLAFDNCNSDSRLKAARVWNSRTNDAELTDLRARNEVLAVLLRDMVTAYEREVQPCESWDETAMLESEWNAATKEYRAAKQALTADKEEPK